MEQQKKAPAIRTKTLLDNPDLYDVLMLNDDFTTMDFVVEVLKKVFFYNPTVATSIMLTIHNNGSCIVGAYELDIAQSKIQKAVDMAHNAGFPLQLKLQPHKEDIL